MRIAIVTQYYPPESVPIPSALAHGLAERGHDVRVLTGFPNYPDGRLAEGYRQSWKNREHDGQVLVRRVPLFISHSRNSVGRLMNYGSFALSSLVASRFVRDADVVYVYATQMTAAIGPSWWHRVRKTPYVLHVQDLWPESITGSSMVESQGLKRVIARALSPWLRGIYRRAAATVGIGPTMSRLLTERGVPTERSHTVFNWAPELPAQAIGANESDLSAVEGQGLNVLYAGNIGDMQDLETVVRAASLVSTLKSFRISVFGSGVAERQIHDLAQELGVDNIDFRGRVPQHEMASHYAKSDFQLVTLKDLPIFRATVPSKLQSSLASAIPVITTVAGDVAELVESHRVGFVSPPGDPQGLARVFRAAYALSKEDRILMGQRAHTLYVASMSRENGIDLIERILVSAAGKTMKDGK